MENSVRAREDGAGAPCPQLKKRYWGQHLWGRGYFCVTIGSMTEEMIKEYIERHKEDDERTALTVHGEFQS